MCFKKETFKYLDFFLLITKIKSSNNNLIKKTILKEENLNKNMSKFLEAIGNNPKNKVLEFLIDGRELDYSISDIAEGSGISRTTLFRIFEELVNKKIIIFTRKIGNAKLYKLNLENPFVKKMIELYDLVVLN